MAQSVAKILGNTDVGRVRASNQDAILADEDLGLCLVADGMGGHAGGEIASQICVSTVADVIRKSSLLRQIEMHPDPRVHLELARSINCASAMIYERSLEEPHLRGMGTTATSALLRDGILYYAHVGDSRLYLIRDSFIYQITYDHSLVSEQVRAGIITQEEAELHHLRNVITRSVGYQEEEDVDSGWLRALPGDRFLICSDGLHGKVQNREISKYVQQHALDAVMELIQLANQRGGDDNISVILMQI